MSKEVYRWTNTKQTTTSDTNNQDPTRSSNIPVRSQNQSAKNPRPENKKEKDFHNVRKNKSNK